MTRESMWSEANNLRDRGLMLDTLRAGLPISREIEEHEGRIAPPEEILEKIVGPVMYPKEPA